MSESNGKFNHNDSVTLKEYFECRLEDMEKARISAYQSMEKRLEGMNEFRDALRDQASRFVTRDEMTTNTITLRSDVKTLEISKANLEGKASMSSVYASYALATISIIISLIAIITR